MAGLGFRTVLRSRAVRATAVGCAAIAILGSCSIGSKPAGTGALGGGSPSAVAGTPTSGSTATSTPTTTTTTPASTHTTAPASHTYPSNYAAAILSAWANGDNAYLTLLTDATTSGHIHGYGNINTHWTLVISDGAAGSTYSTFYNDAGDLIILRVGNEAVSAHHWHAGSVQTWDPMTFPSDATAYTREYVDAWISGNTARLRLLGTSGMITLLSEKSTPAADYTLGAPSDTGPNEVEVEVKDPTTSLDISVIIDTTKLGHQHAIGGCDIGC